MADLAASESTPTTRRDRVQVGLVSVWDKALPFLLGGGTVGGLAAASGGYFPPAWGWSSLALLWIAAAGLLVPRQIALGRAELVFLLALALSLVWTALSAVWTDSLPSTVLEVERSIVYVAAAAAALLVVRKRSLPMFLGGILLGITAVCSYALATHLFPERFGVYDDLAGRRLAAPLGYWNALGILAALGIFLAIGFAARARLPLLRVLCGASVAILTPTFFFTFSRGAWIALGLGLVSMLALDARRLQLATALLAVLPAAVLTIWLGSWSHALTTANAPISDASRQGHRLAIYITLLAALTAVLVLAVVYAERHFDIGRNLRLAYASGLIVVLIVILTAVFVRYGSPSTLAQKAWDTIHQQSLSPTSDLTQRLFSLSPNGRLQMDRVALDDFEEQPILGSGAGTYEQYWNQHRPFAGKVRDAHSLYFERLGELGVIGLGVLLVAIVIPLVAAVRARRFPLVSAAFGAYIAYLVHAAFDWDWEMPAVTTAALFCGVAILVAARPTERAPTWTALRFRFASLAAITVLASFSFVALVGNIHLSRSSTALNALDYPTAQDEARKASRWAPWSSEPWRLLGEAQFAAEDPEAARDSLSRAIERDKDNWDLWLTLALASDGSAQREALARAERLNPLSDQIRQIKESLTG